MDYMKLIVSILIPLIVGFAGSFFTSSSINSWYSTINKPSFNPPNWLFAPVWTLLFILIGISFYLVWNKDFGDIRSWVLLIYGANLALNLLWSLLFFGLRNPYLALIEIVILWFVILGNIIVFYRISRTAGLLLIPYLLWVTFASFLNYNIYILNR
ncbi:TspO/MBR family protein [Thermococcus celer]|uniref:TspO protein n=1 Tax=Thermococcus celer Vu 13 = JCM 8558 TaxID=1293037 RepID=A0A218P288_THECE|nr:TspO/MBR family protein [Thermococcus celer]ASI99046.1 TspO protein [Thermococcus celer] [Thermococcus celer Vu 13 = JCM 8558]